MRSVEIPEPVAGWNLVPGDPNAMVWWDGSAFTAEAVRAGDGWEVVGVVGDGRVELRDVSRTATADEAHPGTHEPCTHRVDARSRERVWGVGAVIDLIVMVIGGVVSVWLAWLWIRIANDTYPDSENWDLLAFAMLVPLLMWPVAAAVWAVWRRPRNLLLAVFVPALLAGMLFGVTVVGALRSPPRSYARGCGSVVRPDAPSRDCTFWRNTQGGYVAMVLVGSATYAVIAGVGTVKAVRRRRGVRADCGTTDDERDVLGGSNASL